MYTQSLISGLEVNHPATLLCSPPVPQSEASGGWGQLWGRGRESSLVYAH
jgi:hypothetical protein